MIGRFWATRISAVMLQKMGIVRPIFKLWLLIHSRQPRFILEPMMAAYFRVPMAASTGRLLTSAFPCLVSRPLLLPLIQLPQRRSPMQERQNMLMCLPAGCFSSICSRQRGECLVCHRPDEFEANALAINPQTPTTLYAGTNGEGAFKSTDGGEPGALSIVDWPMSLCKFW